ncbi:MAG: YtxH domain-containing protein [Vicingaceae bacterium]
MINFKHKNNNIMDNTGKVLFAALVGAAAGAVAGVLLAPASGEETRKKLKEEGERIKDDVSQKVDSLTEGGREKLEEIKKKASEAVKA